MDLDAGDQPARCGEKQHRFSSAHDRARVRSHHQCGVVWRPSPCRPDDHPLRHRSCSVGDIHASPRAADSGQRCHHFALLSWLSKPAHRAEHEVQGDGQVAERRSGRGGWQPGLRPARREPHRRLAPPSLPDRRRPRGGRCPSRALGRRISGNGNVTVPSDLLSSIGICVGAAAVLAVVGWRLRQPLILAYLVTGVVIGPVGFNWVKNQESIQTVAEIGLILLLFIIGLEIDLKKLSSAGLPVLLTGALQVPICIALGLGFFYLLGVRNSGGNYALLYLAACMSLSSTLVVVKLLNDKFELDTLPGRITLGVLVIQDIWAVGMLAVQPNLTNPNLLPLAFSLWKGALLVTGGFFMAKYVLPFLFRSVAKAPELVLVSALAWCFFLASAASVIGLSREMGALIAGVSLSTFPYNLDVMAKAVSIRDFFVTLFFVALGMQIRIPTLEVVEIALAASTFVIVSRLSVVPILYFLKMGHRASLLPAINLAQVSEFSIVIASIGLTYHQINSDVVTIVIMTFAITSVVSTYMINSSHRVQEVLSGGL
ncbi:MAG: cation:proton antiporter, partial [Chloroflexi bacterium]